jgi:tetratricopeptide (TPR) repeat protein
VRLAVCVAAILVGLPATAAAQQDAFRDALVAFHSKLAGDYGDEGPVIVKSLDAMAAALAAWDDSIRTTEQESRSRLASASPSDRVRIHTSLAELYVARGRSDDAMRELAAAIQIDATRSAVHIFRGSVLELMGRERDALDAYRTAWDLDHDDPVSSYLLASRRAPQRMPDEPIPEAAALLNAHARRLQSLTADHHVPLFAELALVPDGAAVTPVFSPARYADGFTLIAGARYQEAMPILQRDAADDPLVSGGAMLSTRVQQAIARLRDGDAENAIADLQAAVGSSPRSSELLRTLANAYADVGDEEKSIEHLERAVALAPDDERSAVALGRALMRAGHADRAERVLLNTVTRLPQSTDAHSALADLYETERGRDALHELEVAASFTVLAGKGALYFRLADLLHRHLEYEHVIEPLRQRVRLNPNNARAHTDLGLAYTRIGRTNDALIELVVASLIGPDDAEGLTAIGQIHFDAQNYAAAEAVLRHAIALAPTLVQARYLLGHTLARLGRDVEGKAQLAEFDRLRAEANVQARRDFEIAQLRRQADHETNAGRYDDAVVSWQQIVAHEPKRADYHVELARVLVRAGRPAAAVEQLQAAAALDADANVYRQMAEIYATLGRTRESAAARDAYKRLLRNP